jgi:class 3 adenylate cyclase
MSGIAAWLENLGLGKYQELFTDNEIDFEVLPELTETDLEKLGIPLGPRKKLLKAIASLTSETPAATDTVLAAEDPAFAVTATSSSQAERRQLSVMFVDLVGSTALSGQLDPEDLSAILRRYQDTASGEINRMEGYVARFMGDGILAYFGWPRALEDAAERAVRAGLAITAEVAKLRTPDQQPLTTRCGIATGLVVVGELIGEGSAQEQVVVGETPNLAARLQSLAKPGTVVVGDSTRRLLGELFELDAMGPQTLKGIAAPVETYTVVHERSVESRYQAQRAGSVLPMMGRDNELTQLLEGWRQVKEGEGQMILVTGEAGIGKSCLLRALDEALDRQSHYRIHYQSSPYHTDSALYPVLQQLARAAEFDIGDSDDTRLDKLEALLGIVPDPAEQSTPLIADLLGIDGTQRYGALKLTPQQQRPRTLQALMRSCLRSLGSQSLRFRLSLH